MKRLKMTSCRTAAMSFAAVLAAGLASAAVYVKPLAEGERRPPMWDEIKREDAASGACTFLYAH